MEHWIAAIDLDSYNYFPKLLRLDQVEQALMMGYITHPSEAEAQKECDSLNSM
jgi:hypothetical protein